MLIQSVEIDRVEHEIILFDTRSKIIRYTWADGEVGPSTFARRHSW